MDFTIAGKKPKKEHVYINKNVANMDMKRKIGYV